MVVEIKKKRMCKEYKEQRKVTCNMIFTVDYISKRRHFHFALFMIKKTYTYKQQKGNEQGEEKIHNSLMFYKAKELHGKQFAVGVDCLMWLKIM